MSILGRRKHSRFLLEHPVDGQLRVREEVSVERWSEGEVVVLSPAPYRSDEHLTLEVPGDSGRRLMVRVRESRPAILADGAIRHRLRLSVEHRGPSGPQHGGHES